MRFTKMHGAGNDYVYLDCFRNQAPADPAALSRVISDRHFGIGSDGLILICPSEKADAKMRMFNADGSEAEMCGNGLRCLAKYLYDHGLTTKSTVAVETGRGILSLELELESGRVVSVRGDMGRPILQRDRIPVTLPGDPPILAPLAVDDHRFEVTCISMGNPHCVLFAEELSDELVLRLGPQIEQHPVFPRRTNVEFVRVNTVDDVTVRVWERGSGETLACGTGACAVAVAGFLADKTGRAITAHLPGGDLRLVWNAEDDHVYLTGPAVEVFQGDWPDSVGET